ncbi:MAG: hypothetical protein ACI854_001198, partial [Arenicella sp.]
GSAWLWLDQWRITKTDERVNALVSKASCA